MPVLAQLLPLSHASPNYLSFSTFWETPHTFLPGLLVKSQQYSGLIMLSMRAVFVLANHVMPWGILLCKSLPQCSVNPVISKGWCCHHW